MRPTLLCTVLLALAACRGVDPAPSSVDEPQPPMATAVADARARNHTAWIEHGPALRRDHAGEWVLIARGEVIGAWPDFEPAWNAARGLPTEVRHGYLYRAGIDDVETVFDLSPVLSRERLVQLGRRVRQGWKLTIAAAGNTWIIGDRQVAWGDREAGLVLTGPDAETEHRVRAVASNLFQGDLTLLAEDARALGLGRFTAPLAARYGSGATPCEKVVVRLRIPEFDIDAPAVAFVLPEDVFSPAGGSPELPALDAWAPLQPHGER